MIWILGLFIIGALSLLVQPVYELYTYYFTYRDPSREELGWRIVWSRIKDLSD